MKPDTNPSQAEVPPMSQKHLAYDESSAEGRGRAQEKKKIIEIKSDGEVDTYDEETVAPKRKFDESSEDCSWSEEESQDDMEKKARPDNTPRTIKIDGRTIVVTPPIKDRIKKYRIGRYQGRVIPRNKKFMGHWKNPAPEEFKGKSVKFILKFNYEVWSEHGYVYAIT